jgi:hypothetical protein
MERSGYGLIQILLWNLKDMEGICYVLIEALLWNLKGNGRHKLWPNRALL